MASNTVYAKCGRLCENPAYGIYAQLAQWAFLVSQVSICQTSVFVMFISRNLSSTCYRHLQRLNVSYQGEISHFLQASRSTQSVQLLVHRTRCSLKLPIEMRPFVLHIQRERSCNGKGRPSVQSSRSLQATPLLKLRHNN